MSAGKLAGGTGNVLAVSPCLHNARCHRRSRAHIRTEPRHARTIGKCPKCSDHCHALSAKPFVDIERIAFARICCCAIYDPAPIFNRNRSHCHKLVAVARSERVDRIEIGKVRNLVLDRPTFGWRCHRPLCCIEWCQQAPQRIGLSIEIRSKIIKCGRHYLSSLASSTTTNTAPVST